MRKQLREYGVRLCGSCVVGNIHSSVLAFVFLGFIGADDAVSSTRELVQFTEPYPMGSIVINTAQRKLYYALGHGMALQYRIAVGKQGMQWSGETFVQSKRKNPGWRPTARMRRANPRLPAYVKPGPSNPLGVRALYLGWSEYRIHGTNAPGSIGRAVSSGCIRMLNEDVIDLYQRVHIGAPVHVLH